MSEARRILHFVAVAGVNTAFSYTCFVALQWLGAPLWIAVLLSTVLGVMFNFFSYAALVFRPARREALIRFILLYVAVATFNYGLLWSLSILTVPPSLGQVICLPILAAMSYIGMRFWVYAIPHPTHERDILS